MYATHEGLYPKFVFYSDQKPLLASRLSSITEDTKAGADLCIPSKLGPGDWGNFKKDGIGGGGPSTRSKEESEKIASLKQIKECCRAQFFIRNLHLDCEHIYMDASSYMSSQTDLIIMLTVLTE